MSEPSWSAAIEAVERQIERGSLFTHTALSETAERVTETETFLYGLVDLLVAAQVVDPDALGQAAAAVRGQLDQRGETSSPGVVLRVDPPEGGFTPVDCAERMPICQAVCCRLHFALSAAEVEAGTVRWDLGLPYRIRQDTGGTCVHNEAVSHDCGVYADRPGVCRTYSCAGDERIWTDFDAMQLNTTWIEENLHATEPRLARAAMIRLPDPVMRPDADG
jgi:Fe-S-cluster containining protein